MPLQLSLLPTSLVKPAPLPKSRKRQWQRMGNTINNRQCNEQWQLKSTQYTVQRTGTAYSLRQVDSHSGLRTVISIYDIGYIGFRSRSRCNCSTKGEPKEVLELCDTRLSPSSGQQHTEGPRSQKREAHIYKHAF